MLANFKSSCNMEVVQRETLRMWRSSKCCNRSLNSTEAIQAARNEQLALYLAQEIIRQQHQGQVLLAIL